METYRTHHHNYLGQYIIVIFGLTSLWSPPWVSVDALTCDKEKYGREGFGNYRVTVDTEYGTVEGFSIPVQNRLITDKRINVFLGIPYAKRPTDSRRSEFRFREPEKPVWNGVWDATKHRPACPQPPWYVRETIPHFHEMDEDCLYMNIYAPNVTTEGTSTRFDPRSQNGRRNNFPLYPVLVFIHGGGFVMGSSQQHPGYFLAERNIVVVTFNYRLNALGFLSTEDDDARGNYGMWDQVYALHFIKETIHSFRGNPNKITIAGHDAGAASVGIHLLSPQSQKMFDYAILMSGSDSNVWAVKPTGSARYYAHSLAFKLGCPTNNNQRLVACLKQRSAMEIANASAWIRLKDGEVGNPWGPVVDGFTEGFTRAILPQMPEDLRRERRFKKTRVLAGLVTDEGAYFIPNYFGLDNGIQPAEYQNLIYEFILERNVTNYEYAMESLTFEYTHYEDPTNITGIRNRTIAMMSDYMFGAGVDSVVKYQSQYNKTYFYVFNYKSHNDYVPPWRGIAHGQELQYVFGFPYFTKCYRELSGVYPRQDYTYGDLNMSEYMITIWTNFTLHGRPTPWQYNLKYFREVYWPEFLFTNQSYMIIDNHTRVTFGYRQQEFSFWTDYFPRISSKYSEVSKQQLCTDAATPFKKSTWSLVAVVIILLIILFSMSIVMCRMSKEKDF